MTLPRLEDILNRWLEEARVLTEFGHLDEARVLTRAVNEVRDAAPEFLAWLPEDEARLRSGRGRDYFRARFAFWAAIGAAEKRGRRRFYRRIVVPPPARLEAMP